VNLYKIPDGVVRKAFVAQGYMSKGIVLQCMCCGEPSYVTHKEYESGQYNFETAVVGLLEAATVEELRAALAEAEVKQKGNA